GRKLPPLPPLVETDSLILDSGQVDLSTPAGGIRLDIKNRMTRQPDGSQKFEAAIWGKQYQLDVDTRWTGQFMANGKWNLSGEIRDFRLALAHINVSRTNGWLSADGALLGVSTVAGQIDAGQFRL